MKLPANVQGKSSLYFEKRYVAGPLFFAFNLLLVLFLSCSKEKNPSANKETQHKGIDVRLGKQKAKKTNTLAQAKEYYNRGVFNQKQGMQEKAIIEFRKAIQLNSSYTEAHREYMNLMESQGKKSEILEEYKGKVQQNPSGYWREEGHYEKAGYPICGCLPMPGHGCRRSRPG